MVEKKIKEKVKVVSVATVVLLAMWIVKQVFAGNFDSIESLQLYMKQFGVSAPIVLTLFQGFQVVFPVMPGYLGCAVGAIAFGTNVGFWCNYIGISLGSVVAFGLARKFGAQLIYVLFSRQQYEKWKNKIANSKSFAVLLFVATLLPLFPDDLLCYLSGLMKMNHKKFIWIIILGKPWCILAYSLIFGNIK